MDVEHIVLGYILLDLADGFHKGFGFNIPYGAADFSDHEIRIFFPANPVDPFLDFVGDVRNDLYRAAQIIAPAFLVDHGLVDPACGHIGVPGQVDVNEPFIMAQIQVRFRPVVSDEHFPVLVGAHGTRVDVDVGIEFLDGDFVASALEQTSQRSRRNPFP